MNNQPSPLATFLETDKRVMFLFVCISTLLLLFVKKAFIENSTAAFEFLADRPEGTMLQVRSAIQYATIPLVYAIKFVVLSFVIWIGCFTFGLRVTYEQCWRTVAASELIFYAPEIMKIIWLMFFVPDPDFYQIKAFYPFSLMSFFDYTTLDARYHYPLRSLNIFEPAYMILLMLGIKHFSRKPFKMSATIILCTYLPIFLLWLVFYMVVYK